MIKSTASPITDRLVLDDEEARFRRLIELNVDDLAKAFGLQDMPRLRPLFRWLSLRQAAYFAHDVMAYDAAVESGGLAAGGRSVLPHWTRSVRFVGQDNVPNEGPVLLVSNHPGLTDTVSLFAAIPRTDIRIIAADRMFLRTLIHTMPYLLLADDTVPRRQAVVRAATRHLRAGGALLTFPAGTIEPDPALYSSALPKIDAWQGRIDIFPRLVPNVTIVPTIVDGVVSPLSLRNPLIYLRRTQRDRDWMAASLQVIIERYKQVNVTVTFGTPIRAADHAVDDIENIVLDAARQMVRSRQETGGRRQ